MKTISAQSPRLTMTLRRVATAGLFMALSGGLLACSEKSQELGKGAAGTTVSRDTKAYDAEASKYAAQNYKRGDKTAWETHMRTRMQGQDEYSRLK